MRLRLRDDDIERLAAAVARREPVPQPASWLELATHRRIRVHTTDNHSIEGVLRLNGDDGLLLWGAQIGKALGLEGEVFIPREKVSFVQTVRM